MVDFLKKVIKYGSYLVVAVDMLKYAVKLLEANEKTTEVTFEDVKE